MAGRRDDGAGEPRPTGRPRRRALPVAALSLALGGLGGLLPLVGVALEEGPGRVAALPLATDPARLEGLSDRSFRLALVDRLGLDADPDFTGAPADTAEVALDLLTGREPPPSDPRERALASLDTRLGLRDDGQGGTVLTLSLDDREKARDLLRTMASLLEAALPATVTAPDAGEDRRIADFLDTMPEGALQAALARESRLTSLDDELARLAADRQAADRQRARLAAGAAPGEDAAPAYVAALTGRADARAAFSEVERSLGPRHPAFIAARAALDAAETHLADVTATAIADLESRAADLAKQEAAVALKRDGVAAEQEAAGVDLAYYRALLADDGPTTAAIPLSPGAPLVLGPPMELVTTDMPLRPMDMLLGALSGLGAGLFLGIAALPARRPTPRPLPTPQVEPLVFTGELDWEDPVEDEPPLGDEIRQLTDEVAALRQRLASVLGRPLPSAVDQID